MDHVRVALLLKNLLGNAIRYTRDGGVRLDVDVAGDRLEFRVTDSGPGIAEEDREYVRSFGGPGKEPGKLRTPHGMLLDTRGEAPALSTAAHARRHQTAKRSTKNRPEFP